MRQGNWEPFIRAALDGARLRRDRAASAARDAEAAFRRRLPPGMPIESAAPFGLRRDPMLHEARESFREAHRRHVALRDECAGFEADLDVMEADPHP